MDSVAGKRGGYRLSKSPEKITMGEVVRHFDGYLAPLACVSVSDYKRCSQEPVCRFRRVMRSASHFGTRPECSGRSALPARLAIGRNLLRA